MERIESRGRSLAKAAEAAGLSQPEELRQTHARVHGCGYHASIGGKAVGEQPRELVTPERALRMALRVRTLVALELLDRALREPAVANRAAHHVHVIAFRKAITVDVRCRVFSGFMELAVRQRDVSVGHPAAASGIGF